MEEMPDTKPELALILPVVLENAKPLEYYKDTLGLRCEGLDPCELSFESIVSRKEVDKIFPRKHRKNYSGFPLRGAVDNEGRPDPGMVAFAEDLLQKVYGCESRRNPGLAFVRGVIADRRGVAVNWAEFAYSCQFKAMKATPCRRSGKRSSMVLGMDGKNEKILEEESPEVDAALRRGFRGLLEDQDKGALIVRPEGPDKRRRMESAEQQIRRAEVRKRAGEGQLKELQSCFGCLEKEMDAASSKKEDVASSVSGTKKKAEALRAQWFAVTDRIERNLEERSALQDNIQAFFAEKKRLLSSDSATRAEEEQMTNLELEYAQEQLSINLSEGNLLQRKLASQEQIEVALRQVVESSESILRATTDSCRKIGARLDESMQELRSTKTVADQLASVYYLYRATDKVTLCPESIAQPSEYPEELKPPRTISINACPVCSRWFFCGDWVGASCGCLYHPHCLALWFQGSQKNCCKIGCEKRMHPDWLTSWGKDWDPVDELMDKELGLDERRKKWKEDACKAVDLQEANAIVSSSSQVSAVDNSSDDKILPEAKRQRKDEGTAASPASPASVLPASSASVLQEEAEGGTCQVLAMG